MEKIKHTLGPLPVIDPYVTTNGGVVILNGPFPIDQAHRVARLCKAAPDLLEALKEVMEGIEGREKRTGIIQLVPCVDKARAAIAKAESQE